MKSLFGRGLFDACPVAERSEIFVDTAANEVRRGRCCVTRISLLFTYLTSHISLRSFFDISPLRHFALGSSQDGRNMTAWSTCPKTPITTLLVGYHTLTIK